MIVNKIKFPEFAGVYCIMMPIIQGDSSSLPEIYKSYADIIDSNYIEKGKIGFLTIDESFVQAGKSQRGFNSGGITRNVHIDVGRHKDVTCWGNGGGTSWRGEANVILEENTEVLIANSIANTCMYWNTKELRYTKDGDLSNYIKDYPENTGILMGDGEMAKISIFTPHECIAQSISSNRQFFRIVGEGVNGRENYFTINPLINN